MNRNFIRLNANDNYLSFGNLCRVIKDETNDKTILQAEIFEIIFDVEGVADSTVNNYCTGFRPINASYKKIYKDLFSSYKNNNKVFLTTISNIINLLNNDAYSYSTRSIQSINNDRKLHRVCDRLYTISKNDSDVSNTLSSHLLKCLNNNDLYTFLVYVLEYTILDKIQPIYIEESFNDMIEKSIYDTNISMKDIKDFIQVQLNAGIWSLRAFRQLADKGNPLASFEMASMEYNGIITGSPRYDKAYSYYMAAASHNHPVATWAIGYLYYNGDIGTKSKHDMSLAITYFNKARKLKCANAYNSFGLIFLRGSFPHIKINKAKAIKMFELAASLGNIYACNNLGKIYEDEKKYAKAFEYYSISAENNDSWACNKMGEFYRKGLSVKKDLLKAYELYEKSSDSPQFTLCPWSNYNLANYFYIPGCLEIGINRDIPKAIQLLDYIKDKLPEARKLLEEIQGY